MTQASGLHNPRNDQAAPPMSRRGAVAFLIVVLIVAAILAVTGIIPRVRARTQLQNETNALAAPDVLIDTPKQGKPSEEVVLPGNIFAYSDAPIYARTSGYLKRWYFDIGAHVKQGDLLAEIETPELDEQLRQARADLETAQANTRLAAITAKRTATLVKTQSVSEQERDNAAGSFAADQAI